MINTNTKGQRVERIAADWLRRNGYSVHRTIRANRGPAERRRSIQNDVWGCFDLLAKKAGEPMRLIQVTASSNIRERENRIRAAGAWDLESAEIWRWVGGGGKRTDDRTGKLRPRFYFQIYRMDNGFALDKRDRIFVEQA